MKKIGLLSIILFTLTNCLFAQRAKTKKMHFGVFFHYLHFFQNEKEPWNQGKTTSWDSCVNSLNVNLIADQASKMKAEYVIFTTQQADQFLCLPNATYEKMTGYKRGEVTPNRDLISDLYTALAKKHIKLFLYATGDGPRADRKASLALHNPSINPDAKPNTFNVDQQWVTSWSTIIRSISLKYKNKISGWWIDGCYPFIGYNKKFLIQMVAAAKAGNKNALVGLNSGPADKVVVYNVDGYNIGNYTAGESNKFEDLPAVKSKKGVQWHILSYLGSNWAQPGLRYSPEYMSLYINKIAKANGMVTVDLNLRRDGSIDPQQYDFMLKLKH
ncbi:alpha-L-fucosidase [Mucilaginibacter polytrichastri]|uniref:Glycoside hydrolase family 29 N-terminal domain-containing protein n=1 Tax=Mucilaginibacter polytrichastri TaxID=1302689 RepID=A0A1Q5ZZ57_9SPHI|nr:alpha-L-fucosidase [Mucilaginibacter polytrichastri]OKS87028.1 hypothetical protein RG47T_2487 [Mucilaginibacter polytrichastri]SFS86166.1 Alpha-L-fucosidase [Mucilaginibacter polytrichastri]